MECGWPSDYPRPRNGLCILEVIMYIYAGKSSMVKYSVAMCKSEYVCMRTYSYFGQKASEERDHGSGPVTPPKAQCKPFTVDEQSSLSNSNSVVRSQKRASASLLPLYIRVGGWSSCFRIPIQRQNRCCVVL